ncbi:hypothetical protein [Microbacterium sp. EST19A]|uniref:hypothetical protein n=1 Tax=Microbacterium sp. EST19A TaxID=2862681 RepID=UPI001CBF7042|nr:hypothetical protein [Microbacterium sp. EST19A]
MARSRSRSFTTTIVGVFAVGSLLALSACAPPDEPVESASPSATPPPTPYAGPAVFVGDELDLLLLAPDELRGLLPGIVDIGASSSVLEQISDGGGPQPAPDICSALFVEQSLWSVGARSVTWAVPDDTEVGIGRLTVLQFADEAHAAARMDQLVSAADQCGTFDYNGPATFDAVVREDSENARALAGTTTLPENEGGRSDFQAFASVGNVLVQLWQPVAGADAVDADAAAALLQDRAEEAHAALVDELTENPPETTEERPVDASAPWGEWAIDSAGIGPIRLGDEIDAAIAAVPGAEVVEPEYEGDPWKIVNADGTASLLIQPVEDGTAVASVTAGNDRWLDETAQDGAALPSSWGVRVGDPVADAVAALPGGTTVTVASSGDDWYDVATRDGRLFRFTADRDVVDPESVIIGITVEDATQRRMLVFG